MDFVIHDAETTGANVRFDQPLQIAAVRADDKLNELGAIDLRCRRLPHIVPHPKAFEVTGIDPFSIDSEDLMTLYEFACEVHDKMSSWGPACFMGYNSISFDDELMRSTFYHCLLEPYVTNTKGSFRADLYNVVRTMVALMPGIIKVPMNEQGKLSFRLEHIVPANGYEGLKAHDALGDVRGTLWLAKLLQTRAPKLFDYLVSLGQPKVCDRILDDRMVLLMTHYGEARVHLVGQVANCPSNPKHVGCFDLSYDPSPYLDMTPRQLAEAMATDFKILRTIKTNAQPMIFSLDMAGAPEVTPNEKGNTVTRELAAERFATINAHEKFRRHFLEALDIRHKSFEKPANVEEQIYDGFPPPEDKRRMEDFHRAHSWKERLEIANAMEDQRLRKLGFRLVLFFGADALAATNRKQWLAQMHRDRILSEEEKPWTTLKTAREGLVEIADEKLRAHYAKWYDQLERSITGAEAA